MLLLRSLMLGISLLKDDPPKCGMELKRFRRLRSALVCCGCCCGGAWNSEGKWPPSRVPVVGVDEELLPALSPWRASMLEDPDEEPVLLGVW